MASRSLDCAPLLGEFRALPGGPGALRHKASRLRATAVAAEDGERRRLLRLAEQLDLWAADQDQGDLVG